MSLDTGQDAKNVFLERSAINGLFVSHCPTRLKEHLKEGAERFKEPAVREIMGIKLFLDRPDLCVQELMAAVVA